ncbi:response regulator [Mucilaginibacter lappiensis]|uniref:response regulator n=1 Tax=Mucilaginibacter lappiensis TaxID=354630 RepID=UPI003D1CA896
MNIEFSFIVIDDSELDRFVTQKFLERSTKSLIIKTFQNAQHALEIISETIIEDTSIPTIILLDLQMPVMNGLKFVEEFEKFPAETKKNYRIIVLTILSSASHPGDIDRILTYETVNSIIEKPLTKEKLVSLLKEIRSAI